jgi:hypothetical protein
MDHQHLYRGRAYHEAGHAVVAHALGFKLRAVLIRYGELSGKTWCVSSEPNRADRLVVLEAGGIAQALFDADTIDDPSGTRAGTLADDMVKVITLIEEMAPDDETEQRRLERAASERAEKILREPANWRAVEALASRLVQRGFVCGNDARGLIDAAKLG